MQVTAKTTASDCGSCSNFVHPSVSYVMHIAFASHTLPGGRYRARYQTRYRNVTRKIFFSGCYILITRPLLSRYSRKMRFLKTCNVYIDKFDRYSYNAHVIKLITC